jgi:hypothetical protein
MEHAATSTSKNCVSRFAVMIADFCNKIGTFATSTNVCSIDNFRGVISTDRRNTF